MDNNVYAEVRDGKIVNLIRDYKGDYLPSPNEGNVLIDVTQYDPPAVVGQNVLIRYYAIIVEGKVVNIILWHENADPALGPTIELVDITSLQHKPGPGWTYVNGAFQAPPEEQVTSRPVLVITGLTSSDAANTIIDLPGREVTCKEGTTLTAAVELHDQAGIVIPLKASFRMPVKARDGREFVVMASFQAGVAHINVPFASSGVWTITEAAINSALPAESQMTFAGFTAYVVV